MKVITEEENKPHTLYQRGDVFQLIKDGEIMDTLMISQDAEAKYYFVSLDDKAQAGSMYGWGNGDPADSTSELLHQILIDEDEKLEFVKDATLTVRQKIAVENDYD